MNFISQNIDTNQMSTPYYSHTPEDKEQEYDHNVTTGHQAPECKALEYCSTENSKINACGKN